CEDPSMGGEHLALFDNDHTEGTYLALAFLARRYRRITVITPRPAIALDVNLINAQKIHRCSQEHGYRIIPLSTLSAYSGGSVFFENVYTGRQEQIGESIC